MILAPSTLRSERYVAAEAAQGIDVSHSRTEYFAPIPDSAHYWCVELFAAVMSTFRWSYP